MTTDQFNESVNAEIRRMIHSKAVQACNAGDWPTIEAQEEYWRVRDKDLDRIESASQWFDSKPVQPPFS